MVEREGHTGQESVIRSIKPAVRSQPCLQPQFLNLSNGNGRLTPPGTKEEHETLWVRQRITDKALHRGKAGGAPLMGRPHSVLRSE